MTETIAPATNTARPEPGATYRQLFSVEQQVPRLDGSLGAYINLDNAASTPPMNAVQRAVNDFMQWYSSVHRGAGFKSQLSTHAYEQARADVLRFVGADPQTHVCVFGKNTTEAANKLARRFAFEPGRDVVLVSLMEHHSNDLPYRAAAHTVHVRVDAKGELDEDDFDAKLRQYGGSVALVAVTGASNVTGCLVPARRLAEKAHAAGAQIMVDCAQLAPHRKIEMGALDDPGHFDYVALSGHKLYAPYGTGALIGRRDTFERGAPDLRGGGTVDMVTLDWLDWSQPPEREEAGSPNVVGAVALAAAIRQLEAIGMQAVAEHEAALTARALEGLRAIPAVEVIGDADPARAGERLGVVPFNVRGMPHVLVAAVLSHEFGVAVRNGSFCAQPYTQALLGLSAEQLDAMRRELRDGRRANLPGMVRASFGLYNTLEEVDVFLQAVDVIARRAWRGSYRQDPVSGDYVPEGWAPNFEAFFRI
jgi:cysteine desulfurase / selenocysteine lyase